MNEFEKQLAGRPLKSVPAEWRAQILGAARAQAREVPASARPLQWLRELFWPNPQAWGALAAIWIVIAAFESITPAGPSTQTAVAKAPVTSVAEQQRELARAIEAASGKSESSPADRPRGARKVDYAFA
jgi:hypothetical protein